MPDQIYILLLFWSLKINNGTYCESLAHSHNSNPSEFQSDWPSSCRDTAWNACGICEVAGCTILPCYVRNSVYYLYYVSSTLSNQQCSVCSFSGRKIFSDEKIHGHTIEYILAVSIFKLECRSWQLTTLLHVTPQVAIRAWPPSFKKLLLQSQLEFHHSIWSCVCVCLRDCVCACIHTSPTSCLMVVVLYSHKNLVRLEVFAAS